MPKLMRTAICSAAALLLVGMTVMLMHYRQETRARAAHIETLATEAKQYEAELTRLKREQEVQELHIYKPEGPGAAVIAFRIADEESLQQVLNYGTSYGFTPAILVNTAEDDTETLLTLLRGSGLDVVFYSVGFTADELDGLQELQWTFRKAGCGNTQSYLLRAADDTEENRAALTEAGIRTLFLYGDTLDTQITEDGTAMLNYSYVNKSGYSPANRLVDLAGSEQALLFAIDMKETTVTEHQMEEIVSLICREGDNGAVKICTVDEAVQTVRDRVDREQGRLHEFFAAQDERNTRIEELEAAIREIYSHWDD